MIASTVLVTGSSGLVGSAVAQELDAAGWMVRGIDARSGRWTQYRADIREPGFVDRAMDGAEAVVHTAALHAPHVGQKSEREFRSVNVGATEQLLTRAIGSGVRRFLLRAGRCRIGSTGSTTPAWRETRSGTPRFTVCLRSRRSCSPVWTPMAASGQLPV